MRSTKNDQGGVHGHEGVVVHTAHFYLYIVTVSAGGLLVCGMSLKRLPSTRLSGHTQTLQVVSNTADVHILLAGCTNRVCHIVRTVLHVC